MAASRLVVFFVMCLLDAVLPQCGDFTVAPMSTVIPDGGNACLMCDFPDRTNELWFRESTSITDPDESCNCFIDGSNLCFTGFSESDEGMYSCSVGIPGPPFGVTRECEVTVSLAEAPTINPPASTELTTTVGSFLLLPVTYINGTPPEANVTWQKDGRELNLEDDRLTVHGNGSLSIAAVTAEDRGLYSVTVENIGGSDTLDFQVFINFVSVDSLVRNQGTTITFTCMATGHPRDPLSITWINTETMQPVTIGISENTVPREFETQLTSTLTISDQANCAMGYECRLTGQNGFESSMSVEGCTGAPSLTLTVNDIPNNFTAVNVTWLPSSTVDSYLIEYRLSGEASFTNSRTVPSSRLFVVISGLQSAVEYEFRGAAVLGQGAPQFGEVTTHTITACPSDLSRPITNVMATLVRVDQMRTIQLQWNPSSEQDATGYRIYIEPSMLSSGEAARTVTMMGTEIVEYTLPPELCNDVTYQFTIAAINTCGGPGPNSSRIEKACSVPQNRIEITEIIPSGIGLTIQWSTDGALSSIFVTAEPLVTRENSDRIRNNYTVDGGFFPLASACIQDLMVDTFYNVCIHARYTDGGQASDCTNVRTLERENNDVVVRNCIKASDMTVVEEAVQGPVIPDWGIAVIVVGVLAIIATIFCFMGLCFACHNNKRKDVDFGSMSSITREGVAPMSMHMQPNNHRPASPSRSCLSYHVKGHSTDWNKHADTLRQMDTDRGTNV